MKKLTLTLFLVLLLLSACSAGLTPADSPSQTAAVSAPVQSAPSATQTAAAPSPQLRFTIQGSAILNADYEPVYDAAQYYEQGWTVWISDLKQADGALYFIEGAAFNDGISCICDSAQKGAENAIVKTALDGSDRKALASNTDPDGYYDMQPFAGHTFFIDGSEEAAKISYVDRDGNGAGTLSLPAGESSGLFGAKFDIDGDYLIVTMDFGSADANSVESYTFRIDADLNVEKLSAK